ncbi:hypothetical protein ABIA35_007488 [Catenulispora sp. MAP12-49]|uniref:hypothetical protein n=1 Tax=Catenulispora sp. MAP12-49 TaxID=3156302 RepID=UPI003517DE9A
MSTIEPSSRRKHAEGGAKRLRRVVPLLTAATVSASLVAAAAGPAGAAARPAGVASIQVAMAIPAAAQDQVITIAPGVTLTIGSTEVQLSLTKEAVTEVQTVIGFGQTVAALVTPILVAAGVPNAALVSGAIAVALGVGSAFLKVCTASDGSAAFTVSLNALPSCSGLGSL